MKNYTLELTEEQVNYILNVVAQRPFAECHTVLAEIQAQAGKQIEPTQTEVVEE